MVARSFSLGDHVEVGALYSQAGLGQRRAWRPATISAIEPYLGHEGYYVMYTLPPDAPSWTSRGGWVNVERVRKAAQS